MKGVVADFVVGTHGENRLACSLKGLTMDFDMRGGIVLLPVVDMNVRLPFSLIWKKDNSSPLLQKFVDQVKAGKITQRN